MRANIPIDDFSSEELLDDWMWLLGESRTVIAMNNFGDMFLRANDGRIVLVNVTWGTLETLAPSPDEIERLTRDQENQMDWFLTDFLTDFLTEIEQAGLSLAKGQCFGFRLPPRMGGKIGLSNVEIT
jgi:hypothetical protein